MTRVLRLGVELIDDSSWMGGTIYLRNLILTLCRLPATERPEITILGDPEATSSFMSEHAHLPLNKNSSQSYLQRFFRWLRPYSQENQSPDVIYPGFAKTIQGAVTLRWIPDFQHQHLPDLFQPSEIDSRNEAIAEIATSPQIVVLSSSVARADFLRFYPDTVAIPRVWRFCSLINTERRLSGTIRQTYCLPEKYLYLPNQFWVHKNHITVFKAIALLRRERDMIIPLVCTGGTSDRRNESHLRGLMNFLADCQLLDQIRILGLIPRNEQEEVLRCATAIVQPSLFEGWSTVLEDARAVGRPVFASDIDVHREQALSHCSYFPPASEELLAELISSRWTNLVPGPDSTSELIAREMMQKRILSSAREFRQIAADALQISNLLDRNGNPGVFEEPASTSHCAL